MADPNPYLQDRRLPDVLVLIQALGVTTNTTGFIYDQTLRNSLLLAPASGQTWTAVAEQHPEFFRVSGETDNKAIMLAMQYVSKRKPSDAELANLLELAVKLHDRAVKREELAHERETAAHNRELEQRKLGLAKVSVIVSLVSTVASAAIAILALLLKHS